MRCVLTCLIGAVFLLVPSAAQARPRPEKQPTDRGNSKREQQKAKEAAEARLATFLPEAMRRAIADLNQSYPDQYRNGEKHLRQLDEIEKRLPELREGVASGRPEALQEVDRLLAFQREALLANPLLDFDRLLLVRRGTGVQQPVEEPAVDPKTGKRKKAKNPKGKLGLPQNWQGNCSLPKTGYDNEIALLAPVSPEGKLTTVFRPSGGEFVGDVDLHFDAHRMLFSMPSKDGAWQVFEVGVDGRGLRQVTPADRDDVDSYDACYLPDGRILFTSTANMQGVPCIGGKGDVANLARLEADGKTVRMLAFEQDHDWCPTLLSNGRVLYTRWEYTDTPHYFTRLLMSMNPDGTNQVEFYGSNSYWPNSLFYARPIPGQPTKFAAIVSGHHGVARMGELVLFDAARGRQEADGAIQRIPGHGQKVEPIIADRLVDGSWPKFLHPYPLSDKYLLVACQPSAQASWGIYLADVFDNLVLIKELPDNALFEPIPLRSTPRPPVIPDRVDLARKDATVYLVDVYLGPGLDGIPRGTVKSLRLMTYTYCYRGIGGHNRVGVESGWEVKRVLGTVPVEEDGSALFRIPANTPVAVQPLDAEGRAVQLMRSWFTAMPGENVSCVGCHEAQNSVTPSRQTLAATRKPSMIRPWYGPPRGFSFVREVQPVLDRYCVGCHNGQPRDDGKTIPNLAGGDSGAPSGKKQANNLSPSYVALHRYVRRPGPESDYHLLQPMEYHTSTSELMAMLRRGHHNVQLDAEARDRLNTWIDLNAPCHGTWTEAYGSQDGRTGPLAEIDKCRQECSLAYAGTEVAPEIEATPPPQATIRPILPKPLPAGPVEAVKLAGWPMTAKRVASLSGSESTRTVDLGDGVTMKMVYVPAGQFVMGNSQGEANEQPPAKVRIDSGFWMGACEVTNAQFQRFDPAHESGYIDQQWKDHNTPGYPANEPQQPVIRVSWNEATAFCRWLSEKTGQQFALPTEAQWEWACRGGTDTPFWFGPDAADFAPYANLADVSLTGFAVKGVNPKPVAKPDPLMAFLPRVDTVNDGRMIAAPVGGYRPNPWGLIDMHGNVAEWTRSTDRAYPYRADDGRDDPAAVGKKVVRGGSWIDRPQRATSSCRLAYEPYQRVFNVGFRVVVADKEPAKVAAVTRLSSNERMPSSDGEK